MEIEILGEQIVHQNGGHKRVIRWLKGWHPKYGTLTFGFTGKETIQEIDTFKPSGTFTVVSTKPPT